MIALFTYQDFVKFQDDDKKKIDFARAAIEEHKRSEMYKIAVIANDYDKQQNTTIMAYQKTLYDLNGKETPDKWSANYKLPSNFFNRFVIQETQYLLGNGVSWENDTEIKLGQDFDIQLQRLGKISLVEGVGFGFWNYDHLDVFKLTEFVPLWDEEDGSLKAGIRFWQIDDSKPMRATLYELDGYTNIMWTTGNDPLDKSWGKLENNAYTLPKRDYILTTRTSDVDGVEIIDGENYPTFPIVPLWGNPNRQSEIVGIRNQIDAYDLIKSGFANDLDNAQIYWVLHNTGGMDDVDLAEFVRRIKSVGAAMVDSDDGVAVESHTLEIPSNARELLLDRLSKDLHRDYMALDTDMLASSNATATQIRAAYEPLNKKADQFEYCVLEFLQEIMRLAGVEDNPSFTRSSIINVNEDIQGIVMASQYLDQEYTTRKILDILGDGDKADEILDRMDEQAMQSMGMEGEESQEPEEEEEDEEAEQMLSDFEDSISEISGGNENGLDDDDDTEIEDMLDELEAELDELEADDDELEEDFDLDEEEEEE